MLSKFEEGLKYVPEDTTLFMYHRILLLLNIKPHESALVRKLFTVQFFLGIATAFLFTSTLTMFLKAYPINMLPAVYIVSAILLFGFNRIYAHLDERLNSPRLLEIVILFSTFSILVFWVLLTFFHFHLLPLVIAAWYMIIYMLVGYAFWGMASIMFNVRESKRLFSIVGAGDIPAKMLGYFSVAALIPYVAINNLLWVSITSFIIAFALMKRYQNQGFIVAIDPNEPHGHSHKEDHGSATRNMLKRFFKNRLVLYISLLSLVAYIVFAFIDFTFLTDIKEKFKKGDQMATFIAIFFAAGRILAIAIKLLFSSRMIARIGLTNALLVTPVLLLCIASFLTLSGISFTSYLYVFGFMVLLTEVLRSTLQEPVFFILFQPLKPHDRLRGHLVAKGYTMPFALVGVGSFLYFYMQNNREIPILFVAEILIAFLSLWIIAVFLIKKQYLRTLIITLEKGYFTGAELFLNDSAVIKLLISKTESDNSIEVIHSLNLLERSGYNDIYTILLKHLHSPKNEIKEYVLSRIMENKMTSALPLIKQQLQSADNENLHPALIKAFYFLEKRLENNELINIQALKPADKKPAIIGLLYRREEETEKRVMEELTIMASNNVNDKLVVLEIIMETPNTSFTPILKTLLLDKNPQVYKKAIEAAGKTKDYNLFNEIVEVAAKHHAFPALQRSILHYGDEIFSTDFLQAEKLPTPIVIYIIKIAGKIKGENSTAFLFNLLVLNQKRYADNIIEALWLKKAKISIETAKLVDAWIQQKMEQSRLKVLYFNGLVNNSKLQLLQQAMGDEIQHDAQVLLKAFAIVYDRQKVDRIIELIGLDNKTKIYNAIEVLELILPGKYFSQLNILVELMNDIRQNQVLIPKTTDINSYIIIEEVLKDNKANFNEWTRSVACYMLPKFKKAELSLNILSSKVCKEDVMFNETKNYVLSMLK